MLIDRHHKDAVLKLHYLIAAPSVKNDAVSLGNELFKLGTDLVFNGGYWVWDISGIIEYYSPNFRRALGFENEIDFPNVAQSWRDQILPKYLPKAISDFESHLADPSFDYNMKVEYRMKHGGVVELVCSGTIINRGESGKLMMLGTHELISIVE